MTRSPFALDGKAALVVGANREAGRAVAVALAEAGADVAVASTAKTEAEDYAVNSVANEIWAIGRRQLALSIDAADAVDVNTACERVVFEFGKLDVLVNAQDLPFALPFDEVAMDEVQRVIQVNETSVLLTCQSAGRYMLRQGAGSIVNVTHITGERGVANLALYGATKAAVLSLTRALAIEWARGGVRVNAVASGWSSEGFAEDPQVRAALERYLPQRQVLQPEDLTGACVYLAGDAAAFMTGQVVYVDGGALSHV